MAAGVMSVGGFVPHPTHRTDAGMCTNYGPLNAAVTDGLYLTCSSYI